MEIPIKIDDLGGTPIFGNTHMHLIDEFLCMMLLTETKKTPPIRDGSRMNQWLGVCAMI